METEFHLTRKVWKTGVNGAAVSLPRIWLDGAKVAVGDSIEAVLDEGSGHLILRRKEVAEG